MAAVPQDAATVILARDGQEGELETYLIRRPDASSFMGGAWVFPGGKVDERDGDGAEAIARAAVRELREETGVQIEPEALTPWARWVTPDRERRRFDARFFLALLPAGSEARRDLHETTDAAWLTPRAALDRCAQGGLRLMPPTLRNLELLAAFHSFDDAVRDARTREVVPIRPTVELVEGALAIILPGDPLHPDPEPRVPGPTRIVLREDRFVSEDP
jgi:8-oxo-dGTP pyrophosphatase MutT (NUDIX family)